MRQKQALVPEPMFNILKFDKIDMDALQRDYNWSVIRCVDWKARNKIVRELKPTDGILALRNEDYESNNIYVMSKITKEELQNELENSFGKARLKTLGTVERMSAGEMEIHRIVQLLLNSLGKKSILMETNAEGHYYMVLDRKTTDDVPEPFYGQLLVMRIDAVKVPESMASFGEVMIKYSLRTLNNTLREALNFDPEKWFDTIYKLDNEGVHTGYPYSEGDSFVYKAVFKEKAHLDLLNWGSSKEEKNLNMSRSVKVMETIERLGKRYRKYLGDFSFAKCIGQTLGDNVKTIYHDRMIDHFQRREVYIYNCTGSENKETVDEFVKVAETLYDFKVKRTNGPGLQGYNIPIIFDDSYYKEKKLPDPHNQPTVGITQFAIIDTIQGIIGDYHTSSKK